tara:strand:+ start:882 stop:1115 length:234 start_codon:yes stop_codon:yes gene_type:complete
MTIYRIYSDEQPDCMIASSLVCSVVVIANSEQEAIETVKRGHGDNFVCDYEDVKVEAVCGDNEAMIVNVEYFNDSHY